MTAMTSVTQTTATMMSDTACVTQNTVAICDRDEG